MNGLAKATLQEIKSDPQGTSVGKAVPVQFNPASLRLTLHNQIEGGRSLGKQTRQVLGKSSSELSFELVFDTADEGSTGAARSVRERTAMVERFLKPKGTQKPAPPKVRFHWGKLTFDGVIASLSIDFELFSVDGIPLRAKMGVTIREQDPRYQFPKSGKGAGGNGGATTPPGSTTPTSGGAAGPGPPAPPASGAGGPTDRTEVTIEGESAAEFAARVGLDPAVWRGVAAGFDDPLSLPGGVEVAYNSALSAAEGVGVPAAIEPVSEAPGAVLGLAGGAGAGLALTAAGGLQAALASTARSVANDAEAAARLAFQAPGPPDVQPLSAAASAIGTAAAGGSPPMMGGARTAPGSTAPARAPLQEAAGAAVSAVGTGAAAEAPPSPARPDPRATSFGFGVPMRPRMTAAAAERSATGIGAIALRRRAHPTDLVQPRDPTTPAWRHLPPDPCRLAADREQARRRPPRPCSCHDPYRHGGGTR